MLQDLIAKYEFWRAKRIKLDKHYTLFYNGADPDAISVRILKKFPSVIVEYNEIKLDGGGLMSFNFNIIANPNLCNVKTKKFNVFTSDIIRNIISESISNLENVNENRKPNLIESVEERTFYEEISAVSEARVSKRKPRKKAIRRNKAVHSKI